MCLSDWRAHCENRRSRSSEVSEFRARRPRKFSTLSELQPAKNLRHVKAGFGGVCRLPREIAAVRIFSHTAKQIGAPTLALLWLVNPIVPRNAHRDRQVILSNLCAGCHVGIEK